MEAETAAILVAIRESRVDEAPGLATNEDGTYPYIEMLLVLEEYRLGAPVVILLLLLA